MPRPAASLYRALPLMGLGILILVLVSKRSWAPLSSTHDRVVSKHGDTLLNRPQTEQRRGTDFRQNLDFRLDPIGARNVSKDVDVQGVQSDAAKRVLNVNSDVTHSADVPHVIHQQWDSHLIPRRFARYVKSWQRHHRTWQYVFWTPDDVMNLLETYYPDDGLRQYEAESTILMKTDIMRFYIMDLFGGVYVDLDMECLRPISDYVHEHPCFITENVHAHSIILDKKDRPTMLMTITGCTPKHPFFRLGKTMLDGYQQLSFADKHFFTDTVFFAYNYTQDQRPREEQIIAAEPGLFLGLVDPGQFAWVKKFCKDEVARTALQVRTCDDLASRNYRNEPRNYSYAVHYWTHFVFWDKVRKLEDVVSIYDVVGSAQNGTQFMLKQQQKHG